MDDKWQLSHGGSRACHAQMRGVEGMIFPPFLAAEQRACLAFLPAALHANAPHFSSQLRLYSSSKSMA
ncbi:hypothetical protein V6N12_055214 [Hibiscus sabdariffa]|uniref:Uncharacterized protein n=1 Tax=Hibiscus sabdariffa TaxID=183260 RepID=A0ABR2A7M8_9ROSI